MPAPAGEGQHQHQHQHPQQQQQQQRIRMFLAAVIFSLGTLTLPAFAFASRDRILFSRLVMTFLATDLDNCCIIIQIIIVRKIAPWCWIISKIISFSSPLPPELPARLLPLPDFSQFRLSLRPPLSAESETCGRAASC